MKHHHQTIFYPLKVFLGNDDGESDSSGETYWAYCKELDCVGDGKTPEAAIASCQEGINLKINGLKNKRIELPVINKIAVNQDYNGKLMVRLPKFLHKQLAQEAEDDGISLNQYISTLLASRK